MYFRRLTFFREKNCSIRFHSKKKKKTTTFSNFYYQLTIFSFNKEIEALIRDILLRRLSYICIKSKQLDITYVYAKEITEPTILYMPILHWIDFITFLLGNAVSQTFWRDCTPSRLILPIRILAWCTLRGKNLVSFFFPLVSILAL